METIVRDATEADLPAILQIYNQAIEHTTAVFSYKPHTPEMRLAWFREKQSKGYPVLVAESDGVVVGFATYGPFRALPAYKYSVENSVYVTERARRAEFAREMSMRLLQGSSPTMSQVSGFTGHSGSRRSLTSAK